MWEAILPRLKSRVSPPPLNEPLRHILACADVYYAVAFNSHKDYLICAVVVANRASISNEAHKGIVAAFYLL